MNVMPLKQDWNEATGSDLSPMIAKPSTSGKSIDLRDLLELYLAPEAFAHFAPHFDRLGALGGGLLNELGMTADKHGPALHHRDRFGRNMIGSNIIRPTAKWKTSPTANSACMQCRGVRACSVGRISRRRFQIRAQLFVRAV